MFGKSFGDGTAINRAPKAGLRFATILSVDIRDLAGPNDSTSSADANIPNIFAALEEQLGLKLASSKGPLEVLAVDHAERPTAN